MTENFLGRRFHSLLVLCTVAVAAGGATPADDIPAVVATLEVSSAQVKPGDVVELRLKIAVNPPWYVYGRMSGSGGQQPMGVRLKLPEGVQAVEGWVWPATGGILGSGNHVLRHKLRVVALSASADVTVTLSHQACSPRMCLPVELVELGTELKVAQAIESAAERVCIRSDGSWWMHPHTPAQSASNPVYRAV